MCPIQNGFRDRAISLYSSLDFAPNIFLPSRHTAPLSEVRELVPFLLEHSVYIKIYYSYFLLFADYLRIY
jgi:hypothetical protein